MANLHIPHYALTRRAVRARIALQRRLRKPFARRRALKSARIVQASLRRSIAEREKNQ